MEPAAVPKPQSVVFDDIAKSLQCQICLNTMADPRTLPCGHNFCWECIINLATSQRASRSINLKCPNSCHQTIRSDRSSLKNLPRNFTLCSIIESMNQATRCESHDDYVNFIDMTDGKLLCEHCLKDEQNCPNLVKSAKIHPVAQADPFATPSTTVTIPNLSLPPEILPLSIAGDVVKSNLEQFISQSMFLVTQMKSLESLLRNNLKVSEESKRHTMRQVDSIFSSFTTALSEQKARLKYIIDGMYDDFEVRESVDSLSKAIVTISKTAEDTSVMLNAQHRQSSQDKLIQFLTSVIPLQSSFAPDIGAASKEFDAANVFKRSPNVLVTCPTMLSLLKILRSPGLFKVTRDEDIPAPPKSTSKRSTTNGTQIQPQQNLARNSRTSRQQL